MFGFLLDRISVVSTYVVELVRQGLPTRVGDPKHEVLFILDGVGGFHFVPLIVRKVFSTEQDPPATIIFKWQTLVPGEIWTDLVWERRNRRKASELADQIRTQRASYPQAKVHILAFSGGAGLAVWACELLSDENAIETLILAAPAISPDYDLTPALRTVRRCYALVSERDRWILGAGTSIFGTTDRKFGSSAGRLGFRAPPEISHQTRAAYDRLREIRWSPDFRGFGHSGGHTGWAKVSFLREHLLSLLRGDPRLPCRPVRLPVSAGKAPDAQADKTLEGKSVAQ